jgi:hypothetical protein
MLMGHAVEYRLEGRWFDSRCDHWIFQFTLTYHSQHGPGVFLVSNRNEYQESSWGVKGGRRVRLTTLPTSVSRLSRESVGASYGKRPQGTPRYRWEDNIKMDLREIG